ncbi:MAG: efflux RND transporter periplasmic adaptor subunit [Polyangiales bacterium]
MMQRIAALALILVALGCRHKTEDGEPVPRTERAVHVESVPIAQREVPRFVPLTGTLTAELRTQLTANATGRVVRTFVERGQRVDRGALLAQLDVRAAAANAAEAEASVASAKTQLDVARAECERYDGLVLRGAITKQEHDRQTASCKQQLAAVAVSQARVSSASLAVGDGTIRAPFAGIVTERIISVGDYVQPSSKVVTLVVSNPLRLKMTVPERRIGQVKEGALVSFSPPSQPDKMFTGTVRYISGEVRETTRDVVVEAVVPNADGALMPGMFVNVSLHAGEHPMPVVPKTAVFATGDEKSIYVIEDKHLTLRIVKLGVEAGEDVALEEGAASGELAVLKPSASLSDGALIE